MAAVSRVSGPSALSFGKHQLPLHTATGFTVVPTEKLSAPQEGCELTIFARTRKGGADYGKGDFVLEVPNQEETNLLIQKLYESCLPWQMEKVLEMQVSLEHRTVTMIYNEFPSMAAKSKGKRLLPWGDLFLLFQEALGFQSSDYQVRKLDKAEISYHEKKEHLRLVTKPGGIRFQFHENLELKEKMTRVVCALNRLSADGQIAEEFKGDSHFRTEKLEKKWSALEEVFEKAAKDVSGDAFVRGVTRETNMLHAVFDVTKEAIIPRIFLSIYEKNSPWAKEDGSSWTSEELCYFVDHHALPSQKTEEKAS